MGSAVVVGVFVIVGLIFGIPFVVSIIPAIHNMCLERRERRADLMPSTERGLNVFNIGNNDGPIAPNEAAAERFAMVPEPEQLPVYSNDAPPEYMEVTEVERMQSEERWETQTSVSTEDTSAI